MIVYILYFLQMYIIYRKLCNWLANGVILCIMIWYVWRHIFTSLCGDIGLMPIWLGLTLFYKKMQNSIGIGDDLE